MNKRSEDIYQEFCNLFINEFEGKYTDDYDINEEDNLENLGDSLDDTNKVSNKLRNDFNLLKKHIEDSLQNKEIDINRLEYSLITKKFYDLKINQDDCFTFTTLLKDKLLDTSDASKIIFKLIRHTELAVVQNIILKESVLEKIKELKNQLDTEKKKSEELNRELLLELSVEKQSLEELNKGLSDTTEEWKTSKKDIDEQIKKIMPEIIGIMGVFATIIFAVFSGFNEITTLGQSLSNTPLFKILIYLGTTFIILIGIVFISYFAIGKFFNKNLRSCGCDSDKECKHSLIEKHPVILIFLWIGTSFISIGFIIRVLAGLKNKIEQSMQFNILLIVALSLIPVIGTYYIYKNGIENQGGTKGSTEPGKNDSTEPGN